MRSRLIAVLLLAILSSSCGAPALTKTPFATQATAKTPKPGHTVEAGSGIEVKEDTLKGIGIAVWHPWFGVEASLFESLVEEFNRTNEWGIEVSASSQSNFSSLYENVTAALPTPQRPDVVIALPEHAFEWDADGEVAELTPYVNDPKFGLDGADFPSVFWSQDMLESRRVAVPAQRTARLLLWNETWAGELGFDSPPASSDDFRQQACRAHQTMLTDQTVDNDARGGWILDTEPMTAYAWMSAFGGGVLDGDSYRFLTPNNISAFVFLKKLAEDQCLWQSAPENLIADFATRQALFISASLADLPAVTRAFAAANNKDKWSALAYPGDESQALVIYGSSYVILNSTPERQLAAWIFIRWMLDPKQDARFVEATHLFPLRSSTLDLLSAYEKSHPQWMEAVNLLDDGKLEPQLASWRTVKVMLGDGFTDMFFRTDLTSGQVSKVLQQMDDLAQELSK